MNLKLIFFLTLNIFVAQAIVDEETLLQIDQLVEEWKELIKAPGLSLSILRNGQSINRAYGVKDIDNDLPMDENTVVSIGSISKVIKNIAYRGRLWNASFTAVLVVKTLEERYPNMGRLYLEAPLSNFIPESANFTFSDRYRWQSLTFRDLLSHLTCLDPQDLGFAFDAHEDLDEFIYSSRYLEEICPVRTWYVYHNPMYNLAGALIAELSGRTFNEMIEEYLLELGMTNSYIIRDDVPWDSIANISQGYLWRNGQLEFYDTDNFMRFSKYIAAGGILSSSKDMVKYMEFHMNKGKVGDRQIVPEAAMSWLYERSNFDNYGLGLSIIPFNGFKMIYHGGYLPVFESLMSFFPDMNFGLFAAINGPGVDGRTINEDLSGLHREIYSILFCHWKIVNCELVLKNKPAFGKNPDFTAYHNPKLIQTHRIPAKNKTTSIIHKKIAQKVKPLEITGTYVSPSQGKIVISENEGINYLNYGNWGNGPMQVVNEERQLYQVTWERDIEAFLHGASFSLPLLFDLSFTEPETIRLTSEGFDYNIKYKKDLLVPPIPWEPNSCGPINSVYN